MITMWRQAVKFIERPHDRLYGAVFDEDNRMRPEARDVLRDTFLDLITPDHPDVREWVRFALIGSGASYNWDEAGDLDVQIWVSDESKLRDARRVVINNLVETYTCADLGLTDPPGDGSMDVQWYAKPGRGTPEDNMAGQPYACYDIDLDMWIVEPYPLTPEMYADQFILVEEQAIEIAAEAEQLLGVHSRTQHDVNYWRALSYQNPNYQSRVKAAERRHEEAKADLKAFFGQLKGARQQAYTEEGQGIHDERDAIWKLLQVWGIMDRLQEAVK